MTSEADKQGLLVRHSGKIGVGWRINPPAVASGDRLSGERCHAAAEDDGAEVDAGGIRCCHVSWPSKVRGWMQQAISWPKVINLLPGLGKSTKDVTSTLIFDSITS
jgi:hypothetical protein